MDDAKECIQSGWSNPRDCCSDPKSRPRMLVTSKAPFLEYYLAVSTLILNGSSIESHEKKHQPFSLSAFDLEAGRFKFVGENLLGAGAVENELSPLTPSYIVQ